MVARTEGRDAAFDKTAGRSVLNSANAFHVKRVWVVVLLNEFWYYSGRVNTPPSYPTELTGLPPFSSSRSALVVCSSST